MCYEFQRACQEFLSTIEKGGFKEGKIRLLFLLNKGVEAILRMLYFIF